MVLNFKKIKNIDLSQLADNISRKDLKPVMNSPAGYAHYKLLAYIAYQLNNSIIIDIGTHHGLSCLALSVNRENKVITYDITPDKFGCIIPDNVERRIGNIFDLKEESTLLESDFIFLDAAHRGDFELQVYKYLKNNNYKGFIVYDDIHWSNDMIKFWDAISDDIKTDITYMGHGDGDGPNGCISGTGLVDFGGKIEILATAEDSIQLSDTEKAEIKSALFNSITTEKIPAGSTWWNK